MKAIIYVRVSTDEQAEKGYSLKHQEERLLQHCQHNNIEVVRIFKEDHSAKTFERPSFSELLNFLKKNKGMVDLLLFLKWDRFSRNAGDAYAMINQLNRLSVEPQAIEQPLDLGIPENKIMLAFYLAAPEVENDRRSLNTIAGMRRAMKEGRHCTAAPKGYKNARNEQNRPIIIPGKDAHHIQYVFETMKTGLYPVEEVSRRARAKGFDCSKNQLWRILRNPFYYGKIILPAYKDEEAELVQGQHEPLVTEELFNSVQDVLDGRKRNHPAKHNKKKELPLRGFLECRKCGRNLTGSASKGNGGKYFYYHCSCGCNERIKAEDANEKFNGKLVEVSYMQEAIDLFVYALKHKTKSSAGEKQKAIKEIQQEIDKNNARIKEAQLMRLDKEIDMIEYLEVKKAYEPVTKRLIQQQVELSQMDENLSKYAEEGGDFLKQFPEFFKNLDPKGQQLFLGSVLAEKLVFENNDYRTIKMVKVIERIASVNKDLQENKNGTSQFFIEKSHQVDQKGIEH
jgi:DNA invertase Pin-like site-specific DNA recombinase